MSEEQENPTFHFQIIRGCLFPNAPEFPQKNFEDAMDYVPKDDDVIIASYPKTGTTWIQYIVLQIISKGESFPAFDDVIYRVMPFMEMSGIAAVEALESKPRIYKHHIAYNMVQKNYKSKYIYVYRNPEDTIVSYYHFLRSFESSGSFNQFAFNQFFESFVTGNISYGNYFHHILSFHEHQEDGNILMVSYEKLHANRRKEILRIAKFLAEEHYQGLLEDEKILSKVVRHTTFEYMKNNLYLTHPDSIHSPDNISADLPKVNFFRKGIVGDGKNILTDDQREQLKEAAKKILNRTSIIDEWYPN